VRLLSHANIQVDYVSGLRAEDAGSWGDALQYYQAVPAVDPGHRDAQARLSACVEQTNTQGGTSAEVHPLDVGQPVHSLAISPGGRQLATASRKWLRVWSLETLQLIWRKPQGVRPRDVSGAALSRDLHRLATGSTDGAARIWDLATGRKQLKDRRARRARSCVSDLVAQVQGRGRLERADQVEFDVLRGKSSTSRRPWPSSTGRGWISMASSTRP
jgi:hypothetical protein